MSCSTRGEVKYVEGQYNIFIALSIRQGNVPIGGWEFEIRGYIANFCRHISASMYLDLSALSGRPDWNYEIIPHYGILDTITRPSKGDFVMGLRGILGLSLIHI